MANMKRMLVAMVGALLMAVSAVATAQYGSIAFSPNTGAGYGWGFSWGYGSRQDAKYRSVRECRDKGGENCREIGWFQNNCGALAVSPEGGYGTGYGNSKGAAESKALSACRSAGNTNCRVPASHCSTVTVAQSTGFVAKQAQPVKLNRDQMRKVQKALAAQGTNPGPADGVYGAKTRAAIQAWQIKKGYQATGVLTRIQIQMLMESAQQTTVARTGKDLYGSIAFSQEYDGSYAWSIVWNSDGWEPARKKAIDVCRKEGGSDCNELGRFRNTCASLAIGDRGGAGTGGGKLIAEAEQNALARCRNAGASNCKVEVSRCTDKVFEIAGTKKPAVVERKTEAVAEPEPATTESKAETYSAVGVGGRWTNTGIEWGIVWGSDRDSVLDKIKNEYGRSLRSSSMDIPPEWPDACITVKIHDFTDSEFFQYTKDWMERDNISAPVLGVVGPSHQEKFHSISYGGCGFNSLPREGYCYTAVDRLDCTNALPNECNKVVERQCRSELQ